MSLISKIIPFSRIMSHLAIWAFAIIGRLFLVTNKDEPVKLSTVLIEGYFGNAEQQMLSKMRKYFRVIFRSTNPHHIELTLNQVILYERLQVRFHQIMIEIALFLENIVCRYQNG